MIIDTTELKRRYLQRIAGVRDKKVYIGPQIVALDISNSCNLSCRHCWIHSPGNPARLKKAHFLPWKKFVEVVADCVDLKVDQIHLVAAGEPTLHPQFREMMRHLQRQPLKVKILTNATFPLDYCLDVIKADHVLIDLGAVDRKQYLDVHGKDLFARVVKNIKKLVSLRDTGKGGFFIEIAYIVSTVNIDQKQKMRSWASALGVNKIYFKKMVEHPYNRDIVLPGGCLSGLEGKGQRTPPECLNGWFYLRARTDYNTSFCCHIPQMRLGSFDRQSLKQLWLSKHLMNMRLLGKYGHIQKVNKACQTCPFYDENVERAQSLAGDNP